MSSIPYTIIIYPIVQIIEFVFVFAYKLFKETGISIIFVSGAISVLCLPLYIIAERWQEIERDTQKRFSEKIKKIKSVFKGDEQYMVLSVYYRQNHYHPIYSLRSTFGVIFQIPFFIAAYSYLSNLDALKGASFLFFSDLGQPDALINGINVLPVLMTIINCAAGIVYTHNLPVKDKVQVIGVSLVFLILLYNSPSGLVLYWTLNNVFSLFKNFYLHIKIPARLKHILLNILISLFCLFVLFYIIVISSGVQKTRIVVGFVFGLIGILPWFVPILTKAIYKKFDNTPHNEKNYLLLFFLSCFSLWFLTGLFIPSMLVVSSPQEFSFIDTYTTPLYFILNTALQSFGFCIFWTTMIFFLFSKKSQAVFTAAGLIIMYCALFNTFLFPGNHGLISINMVFGRLVSYSTRLIFVNILLLLIISAAVIIFFLAGRKKIFIVTGFVSILAILGYSIMNLFIINNEYNKLAKFYNPEQIITEEIKPIFHLSKSGKNIVVMMLDRASGVFMPYIFNESPELYEKYSGFTLYPNTISFSAFTKDGAPPLFGGYEYTPLEINKRDNDSIVDKHNESLLMLPILLNDAGFSVTVTDPPYANGNWKADLSIYKEYPEIQPYITDAVYTDLWLQEHNFNLPSTSFVLKRNILWYSLFRVIPPVFRQSIYADGNWCAPVTGHALRIAINGYSVLDYLSRLTGFEPQKENTALILVNNTTHSDTFMQAPEYRPVITSTNYGTGPFPKEMSYHTSAAAVKRLVDWFEYLKEEGVYNNTRIILVSDHGPTSNFAIRNALPYDVGFIADYNPTLFFKDFNAEGDMKIDTEFMTNADTPSLALQGIIEDPENPFTGNKIGMYMKESPLYIAMGRIANRSRTQLDLNQKKDYYVHKNIYELKNWIPADTFLQTNF